MFYTFLSFRFNSKVFLIIQTEKPATTFLSTAKSFWNHFIHESEPLKYWETRTEIFLGSFNLASKRIRRRRKLIQDTITFREVWPKVSTRYICIRFIYWQNILKTSHKCHLHACFVQLHFSFLWFKCFLLPRFMWHQRRHFA